VTKKGQRKEAVSELESVMHELAMRKLRKVAEPWLAINLAGVVEACYHLPYVMCEAGSV
jgi:hypothetical protein